MYVTFFPLDDLKTTGESWTDAFTRVDTSDAWDPRTYPLQLFVKGMLAQNLAAAEEASRRQAQNASFTTSPNQQQDNIDRAEIHLSDYGDDEPG
ncbi:unnamed protein product, partial [Ectocarpus fasciculatus]